MVPRGQIRYHKVEGEVIYTVRIDQKHIMVPLENIRQLKTEDGRDAKAEIKIEDIADEDARSPSPILRLRRTIKPEATARAPFRVKKEPLEALASPSLARDSSPCRHTPKIEVDISDEP